jgi:hypothetical protein
VLRDEKGVGDLGLFYEFCVIIDIVCRTPHYIKQIWLLSRNGLSKKEREKVFVREKEKILIRY